MSSGNPKLRPCPDCEKMISRLAPACPNCGRPLKPSKKEVLPDDLPEAVPADDSPQEVASANETLWNAQLFLWCGAVVTFFVLPFVLLGLAGSGFWFLTTLVVASVCFFLGGIVGSFKQAATVGALLGALFGPLGVIGVLAIDGRSECPSCRGKLNREPGVCPHCQVRLTYQDVNEPDSYIRLVMLSLVFAVLSGLTVGLIVAASLGLLPGA